MTDFSALLRVLTDADIRFIMVGGVAAGLHGSARTTTHMDIVYDRSRANVVKLVGELADLKPYLRGAPPGLPFRLDAETIARGLNFTLLTTLGDLDILGEITGGGTYLDLLPFSIELEVFGHTCRCLDLEKLIHVKRAAGRPKDFESIAELEAIREEQQAPSGQPE